MSPSPSSSPSQSSSISLRSRKLTDANSETNMVVRLLVPGTPLDLKLEEYFSSLPNLNATTSVLRTTTRGTFTWTLHDVKRHLEGYGQLHGKDTICCPNLPGMKEPNAASILNQIADPEKLAILNREVPHFRCRSVIVQGSGIVEIEELLYDTWVYYTHSSPIAVYRMRDASYGHDRIPEQGEFCIFARGGSLAFQYEEHGIFQYGYVVPKEEQEVRDAVRAAMDNT